MDDLKSSLIGYMFPRTGGSEYGDSWNDSWALEKRICSAEYFDRYFSYGVPQGDLPDATVDAMIAAAESRDDARTNTFWLAAHEKRATSVLIRRLRYREAEIPEKAIPTLLSVVAKGASQLPREDGALAMDLTFTQAGVLTGRLLTRIQPNERRLDLLLRMVSDAASMSFVVECFRWATKRADSSGGTRGFLDEVEHRRVSSAILERLRNEIGAGSPFRLYGHDAAAILYVWVTSGDVEQLRNAMRQLIEREGVRSAEEMIRSYCGRSWGSDGETVADFSGDGYKALTQIIDPDFLFETLRRHYGPEVDHPE